MSTEDNHESIGDLKLKAFPFCSCAFDYWLANRSVHGHTYFFSWLHQTQGITKIIGLITSGNRHQTLKLSVNSRAWIEFADEQSKLMFILRWSSCE